MRLRTLLILILVLLGAGACIRLGFWQLSRLQEKREINAARRAAAAAPPRRVAEPFPAAESLAWRTISATGRYDETRQILLVGRSHEGEPGVEVVTPLILESGAAVLVNRGWLYAADAFTVRPQEYAEPGVVEVRGQAEPPSPGGPYGLRAVEADSVTLLATRGIDLDSLTARLPYHLAPFVLAQVPGLGVPAHPRRVAPPALDESRHLSYAIQWFSFAVILLGGMAGLAWTRWRSRVP